MFAKVCNLTAVGALAVLLSACGAGNNDATSADAGLQGAAMQPGSLQTSTQEAVMASMHGGGASMLVGAEAARLAIQRAQAGVLDTRATNPAVADDDARERMALSMVDYEAAFSIQKNREYEIQRARELAAEDALAHGLEASEDCPDLTERECLNYMRVARR